jgi:Rieske Fe-S protein
LKNEVIKSITGSEGKTPGCESCLISRREVMLLAASVSVLSLLPIFAAKADVPDQWTAVGKVSDFTKGLPVLVNPVPSEALYVTKVDDKTFVVVSAKCTHRGCEVAWDKDDTQFECPCHGAAFTATGKNVHGTRRDPSSTLPPLLSLPTRINGVNVEANLAGVDAATITPRV